MFMGIITTHHNHYYDVIPWALTEYLKIVISPSDSIENRQRLTLPHQVKEFVLSLTRHFQATQPLVRYGAAMYVDSILQTYPPHPPTDRSNSTRSNPSTVPQGSLFRAIPNMYLYILSGCLDSDYFTASLYLSLLKIVNKYHPNAAQLHSMIDAQLSIREFSNTYILPPSQSSAPDLAVVLRRTIGDGFVVPGNLLVNLSSTLQYVPHSLRTRQLLIIETLANNVISIDPMFIQNILPGLRDPDVEVSL